MALKVLSFFLFSLFLHCLLGRSHVTPEHAAGTGAPLRLNWLDWLQRRSGLMSESSEEAVL